MDKVINEQKTLTSVNKLENLTWNFVNRSMSDVFNVNSHEVDIIGGSAKKIMKPKVEKVATTSPCSSNTTTVIPPMLKLNL